MSPRLNQFLITLAILAFSAYPAGAVSPDAIGIRVMTNPDHLSAGRWYLANVKNPATPQNLTVDGYEAVRDGRSVYVNAANIDATGKFYDNIYLLSFNQDAEPSTVDIFGQILAQMKFNANIADASLKNKIRNDTRRLSDLSEMNSALARYKASNGRYPVLRSGSYLAGKSMSVWPSWQATLGKELNLTMPVDPVNKLGSCPGYDSNTCWSQEGRRFATNLNQPVFPDGSRVYFYSAGVQGAAMKLCAQLETDYPNLSSVNCY